MEISIWFRGGIVLLGLLFCSPVQALDRFDIIATEELEQMLAARKAGEIDFILVNSLDEMIYLNSSIPGSINIPWSRVDQTIGRLGTDKLRPLIFY